MNVLRKPCSRLIVFSSSPLFQRLSQPYRLRKATPCHLGPRALASSFFASKASAKGMDAAKKCAPCNSKDIWAMSEHSAKELLEKSELGIHGWDLLNEGGPLKLQRSWKTKSFLKALEFFQLVADVAEAEGHHPDLHLVGWNNVKIDLWTHSVGGLTENDFILAAKINDLHVEHLLRRVPTKDEPSA
ncbi:transcriptional coactivator/pterin dehydratase isoform X2 [Wolffia australiana]